MSPEDPERARKTGSRFGDLYIRTFEMELLISGALVFGLLRLPPLLRSLLATILRDTADETLLGASYAYVFAAMAGYALLACFLLHLACRVFWVGIVGLESVFPNGVRWDRTPLGPHSRRHLQNISLPLDRQIELVDDVCSVIFSFAALLLLNIAHSVLAITAAGFLAFGLSSLAFDGRYAVAAFVGFVIAILAAQLILSLFDRWFGAKLKEGGLASRWLARGLRLAYTTTPIRWIGPIIPPLQSNHRPRNVGLIFGASVFGLMLLIAGGALRSPGPLVHSLIYFADADTPEAIDQRYYRSAVGEEDHTSRLPSIQSDVIEGPYVKLFLPYSPNRRNDAIAKSCPELEPLRAGGVDLWDTEPSTPANVRAAADCLADLHDIELDGRSRRLDFKFTRDLSSGTPGLIAYIDAREMSLGRHEVFVRSPAVVGSESGHAEHTIHFWV